MKDIVEIGAEAIWQAESLRASDRHRTVCWGDQDNNFQAKYRFLMLHILADLEYENFEIVKKRSYFFDDHVGLHNE